MTGVQWDLFSWGWRAHTQLQSYKLKNLKLNLHNLVFVTISASPNGGKSTWSVLFSIFQPFLLCNLTFVMSVCSPVLTATLFLARCNHSHTELKRNVKYVVFTDSLPKFIIGWAFFFPKRHPIRAGHCCCVVCAYLLRGCEQSAGAWWHRDGGVKWGHWSHSSKQPWFGQLVIPLKLLCWQWLGKAFTP